MRANRAGVRQLSLPPPGAARRFGRRHRERSCSARRCRFRSSWRRPGSPASPIRRASWPSLEPPSGRACRTPCRRCRRDRSKRSPRPTVTVADGSRSTSGRTRVCSRDMVDRAAAAGYEALVITVDTANLGRRERDVRRGFELPPKLGLGTIVDGAVHPSWTWRFVRAEPIRFANIASSAAASDQPEGSSAVNLAATFATQFDARLSWDDVEWFRSVWSGPIVIKGIQVRRRRTDRRRRRRRCRSPCPTMAAGNSTTLRHRSTSSHPSPRRSAAASRSSATVACAGGATSSRRWRSGRQRAWPAGRTCTDSPPAASSGVDKVLGLLADDVRRTMALLGVSQISDLSPDYLERIR